VQINDEQQALEALNSVLAWAKRNPDSSHGGPSTGLTWQRGRVIATATHDGTVGMSTYANDADAARKAAEMEQAYTNWRAMRDARVTVRGPVTIIEPPQNE
jgi:ArsR family metal-binding transcriptional regulator